MNPEQRFDEQLKIFDDFNVAIVTAFCAYSDGVDTHSEIDRIIEQEWKSFKRESFILYDPKYNEINIRPSSRVQSPASETDSSESSVIQRSFSCAQDAAEDPFVKTAINRPTYFRTEGGGYEPLPPASAIKKQEDLGQGDPHYKECQTRSNEFFDNLNLHH
jgi:hypothetical protein